MAIAAGEHRFNARVSEGEVSGNTLSVAVWLNLGSGWQFHGYHHFGNPTTAKRYDARANARALTSRERQMNSGDYAVSLALAEQEVDPDDPRYQTGGVYRRAQRLFPDDRQVVIRIAVGAAGDEVEPEIAEEVAGVVVDNCIANISLRERHRQNTA